MQFRGCAMVALALVFVLCATPKTAPEPERPPPLSPSGRYLLPALEVGVYSFGLFAYNRWLARDDFAFISGQSIENNFRYLPRFDNDHIFVNFLGHPYQGAVAYDCARSAGLDFWVSSLYVIVNDLAWEWIAETQAPSINDLVESGPASPLWGEALFRISRLLLAHHEGPRGLELIRGVAAFAADPFGTLNYAMLGPVEDDESATVPFRARLYGGALSWPGPSAFTQVMVGGDLLYGVPREPSGSRVQPFDFFTAHASGAVGGAHPSADIEVLGVLAGSGFGTHGPAGMWGLYGFTEFGTGRDFRWSSTAVGPGALVVARPGGVELRATAVAAGVLMGAAGTTADTDYVEPNDTLPGTSRYAMGPGLAALAELELTLWGRLDLRAAGQSTWVAAFVPTHGWERVDQASGGAAVRLPCHLLLGGEVAVADRAPARPEQATQWGWSIRTYAGLHFGH